MLTNSVVKTLISVLLLSLISVFANAVVITLEPDDYGLGVPLENEYVKVTSSDGSPFSTPWEENRAIRAENPTEENPDYTAPTGNLVFGNYPLILAGESRGEYVSEWGGLILSFKQAVSHVTMLANSGRPDQWFNSAAWVAFDRNRQIIARGYAGLEEDASHEVFEIDIRHENIWSVVMGGSETIPYIYFDHLTFELPDASVPAPNPFALLMIGLAMITLRARFRAQPNSNA